MAFTFKQGDRRPLFVVLLKDNVGEEEEAAVDLTTAGAVSSTCARRVAAVMINRGLAAITTRQLAR